jgi:hypothetical protein
MHKGVLIQGVLSATSGRWAKQLILVADQVGVQTQAPEQTSKQQMQVARVLWP